MSGHGHLYVIGAAKNPELLKIGRSYDVVARCKSLQAGCPIELGIHAVWRLFETESVTLESDLHAALREVNSHGEWFDVRLDTVIAMVERWRVLHRPREFTPLQLTAERIQMKFGEDRSVVSLRGWAERKAKQHRTVR